MWLPLWSTCMRVMWMGQGPHQTPSSSPSNSQPSNQDVLQDNQENRGDHDHREMTTSIKNNTNETKKMPLKHTKPVDETRQRSGQPRQDKIQVEPTSESNSILKWILGPKRFWVQKIVGPKKNFSSDQSWLHLTCPNLICPDSTNPDLTCPDFICLDLTCPDFTSPDLTSHDLPDYHSDIP